MANQFPAAIANEPPPCMSSEDEDSEEYPHGLKLDVASGDPTPVSTPLKKVNSNVNETLVNNNARTIVNSDTEDVILKVVSAITDTPSKGSTNDTNSNCDEFPKENGTAFPEAIVESELNRNEELTNTREDIPDNVKQAEGVEDRSDSLGHDSEDIDRSAATSASEPSEPDAANEFCDIANVKILEPSQDLGEHEFVGTSSRPEKSIGDGGDSVFDIDANNQVKEDGDRDNCNNPAENHQQKESEAQQAHGISIEEGSGEKFSEFANTSSHSDVEHESISTPSKGELGSTVEADQDDFDDEFGDFGGFQSIPNKVENIPAPEQTSSGFEDEDDDFGDFAQVPVQSTSNSNTTNQLSQPSYQTQIQEDTSSFADFQDCSFQSCDSASLAQQPRSPSDFALISSSIIKSLFPPDSTIREDDDNVKLKGIDSEISISKDEVWARVQDFEGSNGLAFKWLNSLTEKRLLRSLNIDNSNIMYHEKWGGIEVPKFAASLVMSPLQPESCNPTEFQRKLDVTVNNNNFKEGMSCEDQDKPPSISAEAQEILRQLPDLSYMRANTLVFPQTSPSGI